MKKNYLLLLLISFVVADPELYFIEPQDGKTYSTEVLVKFGLKDFGVAPAGYKIPNTGHHQNRLVQTSLKHRLNKSYHPVAQ